MNSHEKMVQAVRTMLEAIGENPEREGLKDTPERVARMYAEVFAGLHEDPRESLGTQFEEENHQEMVIVKDITFHSFCEHHLVPFFGVAHVSYIPQGKIVGISKLARLVDVVARRPQVQERMTTIIADTIQEILNPLGVGVVITAEHMCMSARGIRKPGHQTVTSAMRGVYMEDPTVRSEFLSLIK